MEVLRELAKGLAYIAAIGIYCTLFDAHREYRK